MRLLAIPVLLLSACATPGAARSPAPMVRTASGVVVGEERDGVHRFLGVPYAAPPVGPLRWRPPNPVGSWSTPRDATRLGPACPQIEAGGVVRPSSEDCLSLNVWVPPHAPHDPLPVFVWIHGGAFYQGSGGDDLYDGAKLARRTRAIVVTINYRLGALGFLSHPAVARELGCAAAPSVGILDQRAALQWVQRNIAAFDGDPQRVTLFGESAGGWSTCVHLASPGSRGLFGRAIIQSGGCADALYSSPPEAEAQAAQLATKVGCTGDDELGCLRRKPAAELIAALAMKRGLILRPGIWWGPVVDGTELPRQPLEQLRAGDFAHVPLLIGAAQDEGILHTISFKTVSPDEAESFPRDVWGDAAARQVMARYASAPTPKAALTELIGDGVFVCQARRVARVVEAANVPVYLYHFTHALDDPRVHELGATHSVDLFFVFGNSSLGYGLLPSERPLADLVMDAWGAFARTGDPSTPAVAWPRYTRARDQHLTLDLRPAVGAHLKQALCDFWDALR